MLLHPINLMRFLLAVVIMLVPTSLVQAQDPDQETHIKCPVSRELLIQLGWPGVANSVIPDYPVIAVTKRISGLVSVDVDVSPTGTVTAARVIAGEKLLSADAKEAALHWIFRPTDHGAHSMQLNFVFHDAAYVAPNEKPECGSSPFTVDILWPASP